MADMARLTKKSIVGDRVEYVRQKTKRTSRRLYSVPLSSEVSEIIERYKGQNGDYLLPIISGRPGRESDDVRQATKMANEGIRSLAVRVGVDAARLSMYSARHTVATVLDRAGVGLGTIRDMLGHENIAVTEGYVKKHSLDAMDAAGDALRG